MKKIVIALLVVTILLASVSALADTMVVATGGDTYIRIGPGLDFVQIGIVNRGNAVYATERYSIDERGVVWYEIYLDWCEGYGWVSSRYTTLYY